jgi:hypothetical protein
MDVAQKLGYLHLPENILIDIDMLDKYMPQQVVLVTTGSQGEPMSALSRMAYSDHRKVMVGEGDFIIISANPIPGNEKTVGNVVDELLKKGCKVIYESMYEVHVSGHACQEELKIIQKLVKPKYFIPVHGEQKHLRKHADLAMFLGMERKNIYIGDVGSVLEINEDYMKELPPVQAGKVFVDGLGVGDVGSIVLRDRKHLGQDGLIIIVASLDVYFWVIVIFLYYILATMMPIDKIIGKIYPLFAFALLFMAVGILVMLYVKSPDLPEMWSGFGTKYERNPIFPMMFISIACGAISGFHATQSPLMARCITNEKHCRPIFYGAMVTEGIVALIWAAAATYFFHENGIVDEATGVAYSGAKVATDISKDWLGTFGGILAILGIVAAPITSGDTALRSARLIVADFFHVEQRSIRRRLFICIPIFLVTIALLLYSFGDAEGFKIIWRYFAWCNQALSVFTLWAITVWLVHEKKNYWVTLIPALFMTAVCSTYILIAPEGLALSESISYPLGAVCVLIAIIWFAVWYKKEKKRI